MLILYFQNIIYLQLHNNNLLLFLSYIDLVVISLNFKDYIVNFEEKKKNVYTDIIMKKLKEMEDFIIIDLMKI